MLTRRERILTTTDLSRASYAAVRRASHLAKLHQASGTLLHVIPQGMLHDLQRWAKELDLIKPEKVRRGTEARLREWVDRIYLESGVTLDPVVVEGTPAPEIAKQASARNAGLIVIGAHGEHALLDLFVGSTAQKVLRLTDVPVLLVKQPPPFDYERILLPTDFSTCSLHAAQLAQAWFPRGHKYLFHSFELYFGSAMKFADVEESVVDAYRAKRTESLRAELERFARTAGLHVATQRVRAGHAPARIVEYARQVDADLIVMGAYGRSALAEAVLGSVTSHLIDESHCDVLICKGRSTPSDRPP